MKDEKYRAKHGTARAVRRGVISATFTLGGESSFPYRQKHQEQTARQTVDIYDDVTLSRVIVDISNNIHISSQLICPVRVHLKWKFIDKFR